MTLIVSSTARDFISYLDQDEIKEALEALPDHVAAHITQFAQVNEANWNEISSVVEDAIGALCEAESRMDSAARAAEDAAYDVSSVRSGLEDAASTVEGVR